MLLPTTSEFLFKESVHPNKINRNYVFTYNLHWVTLIVSLWFYLGIDMGCQHHTAWIVFERKSRFIKFQKRLRGTSWLNKTKTCVMQSQVKVAPLKRAPPFWKLLRFVLCGSEVWNNYLKVSSIQRKPAF